MIDQPTQTNYKSVTFKPVGGFVHGAFDESAAEIPAFHPATKQGFVVNAQHKKVDVLDLTDVTKPSLKQSLDVSDIGATVNSVAVHGNLVAIAVQAKVKSENGVVAIYDANTLKRL